MSMTSPGSSSSPRSPISPPWSSASGSRSPSNITSSFSSVITVARPHRAEWLVDPKVRAKKRLLILDTPEHVDSENNKLKIGPRTPCPDRPWLMQKIGKNWQKLAKFEFEFEFEFFDCIRSKTVSNVFHGLKNVKIAENSSKIGQFCQF
jgi:hypothetical protein